MIRTCTCVCQLVEDISFSGNFALVLKRHSFPLSHIFAGKFFTLSFFQLSPGGGFGPVSDSGYGVSYMIPDDDVIFFHVSSKVSCKDTDSNRFMDNLYWAMSELKSMTERASKKKK